MVLVNIVMFNCLIFIKQSVCIDCGKLSLCQICMRNAWFYRNCGCGMHGFTGMVGAECTVSPEWCVRNELFKPGWWVLNARFNRDDARSYRDDGCGMYGSTGMMGAGCTVQPGWWVRDARFNRDDACSYRDDRCGMHGSTGLMGAGCKVLPGWWVRNACSYRDNGCTLHGFTGMVCVEINARFHRNGVCWMHGVNWNSIWGMHSIN